MLQKSVTYSISFLGYFLCVVVAMAQPEQSVGVSPGSSDSVSVIGQSCPTFSWGPVDGASHFDLVVYAIRDDDVETEQAFPVTQITLPSTLSWTPSRELCLEPGQQYVWYIRAQDELGDGE